LFSTEDTVLVDRVVLMFCCVVESVAHASASQYAPQHSRMAQSASYPSAGGRERSDAASGMGMSAGPAASSSASFAHPAGVSVSASTFGLTGGPVSSSTQVKRFSLFLH
jgi:hypothetical protein